MNSRERDVLHGEYVQLKWQNKTPVEKMEYIASKLSTIIKDVENLRALSDPFTALRVLVTDTSPDTRPFIKQCIEKAIFTASDVEIFSSVARGDLSHAIELAIQLNAPAAVKYLVENESVDVNAIIEHGYSGSPVNSNTLLDFLESFEDKQDRREIKTYLQVQGAKSTKYILAREKLFSAIENNDVEAVQAILKAGIVSANLCNRDGEPALFFAVRLGRAAIITLLYDYNANLKREQFVGGGANKQVAQDNCDPLVLAATQGHYDCVVALLGIYGYSPILSAEAARQYGRVIEKAAGEHASRIRGALQVYVFLNNGSSIAITRVVPIGYQDQMAEDILNFMASLSAEKFASYFMPLYQALRVVSPKYRCETWLQERLVAALDENNLADLGVYITLANQMKWSHLVAALGFEAVKANNLEHLKRLLDAGMDVNSSGANIDVRGNPTLLFQAVSSEAYDIIDELILRNADVNAGLTNGMTPLMQAAHRGDITAFEKLIQAKADLSLLTHDDSLSAFDYAVGQGRAHCAQRILDALIGAKDYTTQLLAYVRRVRDSKGLEEKKNEKLRLLFAHIIMHGTQETFRDLLQNHLDIISHPIFSCQAQRECAELYLALCHPDLLDKPQLDKLAKKKEQIIKTVRSLDDLDPLKLRILLNMIQPNTGIGKVFYHKRRAATPSLTKGNLAEAVLMLKNIDIQVLMSHAFYLFQEGCVTVESVNYLLHVITGKKTDQEAQREIANRLVLNGQGAYIEFFKVFLREYIEKQEELDNFFTQTQGEFTMVGVAEGTPGAPLETPGGAPLYPSFSPPPIEGYEGYHPGYLPSAPPADDTRIPEQQASTVSAIGIFNHPAPTAVRSGSPFDPIFPEVGRYPGYPAPYIGGRSYT